MFQLIAAGVLILFVTTLFVAVKRRFFARLRGGFGVMLACALVGSGVITAMVLGGWGYEEARHIVIDEQVDAISDVATIAEHRLNQEVKTAVAKLDNVADASLVDRAIKNPEQAKDLLATLQTFNRRLLQLCILDRDGKLLITSTRESAKEPVNRVAVAYALEGKTYISEPYVSSAFGKEVLVLSAPCEDKDGAITGVVTMRYDMQSSLADAIAGLGFGNTGYSIFVDSRGRIMAHPDAGRVGEDISSYPAFKAAMQSGVGSITANDGSGEKRLFVYRQISSPATENAPPLVLLSEMSFAEAMAPVYHMEKMFAAATGVVAIVWALVALGLARVATKPLRDLLGVVSRVGKGDLQARSEITGRDEIGQFAAAFNEMVKGLQERERVKKVFGRYVTQQVAERVLQGSGDGELGGKKKRVTILFADIRNFTTMSEKMAPEQVVEFLNEYFSEMVDAVIEHGGVLDKFIGDGIMAVFGGVDDTPDAERRAVLAGLRMKAKLAKLNGQRSVEGKDPINIGIGIHTDEVVVGNIGTKDRVDYTVIGDGVNTCARVESANKDLGTTLLITKTTHDQLGDSFDCRAMGEAKLKGKSNVPPLFEVLSVRNAAMKAAKAA
jgi:class 3 adenylate cyclase